ncbi:septation protein SepH [Varibaculum vaginae]|uniref:septation protein SepH n=1 Tax=Varibaculum vaginae TaxID=2364797 RepID=UPI000F085A4E|nr:septation protein SepH [Varibaculum vaginae]
MKDLELLGLHPDGNQLILNDEEGTRYALAITQELRDAVRPERPNLEAIQTPKKTVPPRKIQALLRAGSTISEIADKFEIPEDKVSRYATPILAERRHAANLAQACQVGGESDSPHLGELVIDRLAARGVSADSLRWDAVRGGKGPWEIILTFTQDARDLTARWNMEPGASTVSALDQEAIWLTESSQPASKVSSFEEFFPLPSPQPTPPEKPDTGTDALLDALAAARGKRDATPDMQLTEDPDELEELASFEEGKFSDSLPEDTLKKQAEIVSLHGKPDSRIPVTSESPYHPGLAEHSSDEIWDSPEPTFTGTLSETEALNLDLTRRTPIDSTNEPDPPSRPAPPPPAGEEINSAPVLPGMENVEDNDKTVLASRDNVSKSKGKHRRSGRKSIPSWDDIVFGTKPR